MIRAVRRRLTAWLLARAAYHARQNSHLMELADEEAAAAEAAREQAKRRPIDHLALSIYFGGLALRSAARAQAWLNLAKLAAGWGAEAEPEADQPPPAGPRRRRGRPRGSWPGSAHHGPTLH